MPPTRGLAAWEAHTQVVEWAEQVAGVSEQVAGEQSFMVGVEDVVALLLIWLVNQWDLACMVVLAHTLEEVLEEVLEEEWPLNQPQGVDSEQVLMTQAAVSVVPRRSVVVLEVPVWIVRGTWLPPQTGPMWAKAEVVIR